MKNQKGITLIAIIITIIVMLILSATAITLSTNSNGVIKNSEKASTKNYISNSKNVIMEAWAYVKEKVDENEMSFEKYAGTIPNAEKENNELAAQLLRSYLKSYGTGILVADSNNNYVYAIKLKGKSNFINAYKVEFLGKGKSEEEKRTYYIGIDRKVYYDSVDNLDENDEITEVK